MNYLIRSFSIIHRQTDVYLDHQLKKFNLSSKQFMYILCICDNEGFSQENLASELQIDKGAVAKSIQQLENKGFIFRKVSPKDKRQYMLYPTEKSKELYPYLLELTMQCEKNVLSNLTSIESELFKSLLEKLMS